MQPLHDPAYVECFEAATDGLSEKLDVCFQSYFPNRQDELTVCISVAIGEHVSKLQQCYFEFDSRVWKCRQESLVNWRQFP